MKKKFSAIAGAFAAFALAASLSGCSDSADSPKPKETEEESVSVTNSTDPVTMSEAFDANEIWYFGDSPSKTGEIYSILVFDGKDKVKWYSTSSLNNDLHLTYSDLDGLSDEKIIAKAKEYDKIAFEDYIEITIKELEGEDEDSFVEEYGMTVNEAIEKLKAIEYEEPIAQPYELKIVTDDSGKKKKTIKETLIFTYYYADTYPDSDTFGEYTVPDDIIEWTYEKDGTDIKTKSVKGTKNTMYFNGYEDSSGGLYIKVENKKHGGFILDEPGTKGVEETDDDEDY